MTPPFGILVFAVKAAVPDRELAKIFSGSIPFWIVSRLIVAVIAAWPGPPTDLPSL